MKSRDNVPGSVPPRKVLAARTKANEIEKLGTAEDGAQGLDFDATKPSEGNVSSSVVERRRKRPQRKVAKTTPYFVTGKPRGRRGGRAPGVILARTKRRMKIAKAREKLSEMRKEQTKMVVSIQAKRTPNI